MIRELEARHAPASEPKVEPEYPSGWEREAYPIPPQPTLAERLRQLWNRYAIQECREAADALDAAEAKILNYEQGEKRELLATIDQFRNRARDDDAAFKALRAEHEALLRGIKELADAE